MEDGEGEEWPSRRGVERPRKVEEGEQMTHVDTYMSTYASVI